MALCIYLKIILSLFVVPYGDNVGNTTEENSNIFSLIQRHLLPSASACRQ